MTLSATLTTKHVANTVCGGEAGCFMHGPTFMGNPLACAVANASLELLLQGQWQQQVINIEKQLARELPEIAKLNKVKDVRWLGAIGVVELFEPVDMAKIQKDFVDNGVWIRPFGTLVYIMPPFIIKPQELSRLTSAMLRTLQ
jgi:adenosylmethionine-8-amino-7-oxononanoate aminotransferase